MKYKYVFIAAFSTEAAECESGEVRLANVTDDPDEATREGTLQICINSAWGTVCSDNFFDTADAEVFCEQLDGFKRDGWDFKAKSIGCVVAYI